MIELQSLAAFSIKGADTRKFLQGQLTCDLNELKSGEALLGGHCNREGRVVALYILVADQDGVILITTRDTLSEAMAALKHYGMFSKLIWQDLSATHQILGILGAKPVGVDAIRLPGKIERYLMLQDKNIQKEASKDESSWYYQMILQKEAFLTKASIGQFLPQELELEQHGALSFTKGCYLGQEIIARLHYLGKLKRSLQIIEPQQNLNPLDELQQDGKVIGEVVNCIKYKNRYYGLALVEKV